MLEIYTSQFRYSCEDRFDITVKTGNKVFAPTWDMVMGYKNGIISEDEYIKKYLDILDYNINIIESWFHSEEIQNKKRITLVCYCSKNSFCHRKILAKYLEKLFDCKYMGEI